MAKFSNKNTKQTLDSIAHEILSHKNEYGFVQNDTATNLLRGAARVMHGYDPGSAPSHPHDGNKSAILHFTANSAGNFLAQGGDIMLTPRSKGGVNINKFDPNKGTPPNALFIRSQEIKQKQSEVQVYFDDRFLTSKEVNDIEALKCGHQVNPPGNMNWRDYKHFLEQKGDGMITTFEYIRYVDGNGNLLSKPLSIPSYYASNVNLLPGTKDCQYFTTNQTSTMHIGKLVESRKQELQDKMQALILRCIEVATVRGDILGITPPNAFFYSLTQSEAQIAKTLYINALRDALEVAANNPMYENFKGILASGGKNLQNMIQNNSHLAISYIGESDLTLANVAAKKIGVSDKVVFLFAGDAINAVGNFALTDRGQKAAEENQDRQSFTVLEHILSPDMNKILYDQTQYIRLSTIRTKLQQNVSKSSNIKGSDKNIDYSGQYSDEDLPAVKQPFASKHIAPQAVKQKVIVSPVAPKKASIAHSDNDAIVINPFAPQAVKQKVIISPVAPKKASIAHSDNDAIVINSFAPQAIAANPKPPPPPVAPRKVPSKLSDSDVVVINPFAPQAVKQKVIISPVAPKKASIAHSDNDAIVINSFAPQAIAANPKPPPPPVAPRKVPSKLSDSDVVVTNPFAPQAIAANPKPPPPPVAPKKASIAQSDSDIVVINFAPQAIAANPKPPPPPVAPRKVPSKLSDLASVLKPIEKILDPQDIAPQIVKVKAIKPTNPLASEAIGPAVKQPAYYGSDDEAVIGNGKKQPVVSKTKHNNDSDDSDSRDDNSFFLPELAPHISRLYQKGDTKSAIQEINRADLTPKKLFTLLNWVINKMEANLNNKGEDFNKSFNFLDKIKEVVITKAVNQHAKLYPNDKTTDTILPIFLCNLDKSFKKGDMGEITTQLNNAKISIGQLEIILEWVAYKESRTPTKLLSAVQKLVESKIAMVKSSVVKSKVSHNADQMDESIEHHIKKVSKKEQEQNKLFENLIEVVLQDTELLQATYQQKVKWFSAIELDAGFSNNQLDTLMDIIGLNSEHS